MLFLIDNLFDEKIQDSRSISQNPVFYNINNLCYHVEHTLF
jgi:hypothetical protein